ncbi:hypothetical protein M3J09_008004 [Ascochyta lentis]
MAAKHALHAQSARRPNPISADIVLVTTARPQAEATQAALDINSNSSLSFTFLSTWLATMFCVAATKVDRSNVSQSHWTPQLHHTDHQKEQIEVDKGIGSSV